MASPFNPTLRIPPASTSASASASASALSSSSFSSSGPTQKEENTEDEEAFYLADEYATGNSNTTTNTDKSPARKRWDRAKVTMRAVAAVQQVQSTMCHNIDTVLQY
jgi:hypothetical protein